MGARRLLFWIHLFVGMVFGVGVAFLASTGCILAFQPQIIRFAERGVQSITPASGQVCAAPSALLTAAQQQSRQRVSGVQLFSDPRVPTRVTVQDNTTLLIDSCTGRILGRGASRVQVFFDSVRDLHRWVALSRGKHESLRAIKDAANLGFCFLLLSGLVLWVPRKCRAANLRSAMLFCRRLRGRAREWNLHNIAGFWLAIPLLVISTTGSIMAYSWANNLLYRAAGTQIPKVQERPSMQGSLQDLALLDPLIIRAKLQDPRWYSIQLRIPGERDRNVSFSIDEGKGGKPQQRVQLVLALKGAKLVRWEPFGSQPLGRQWRLYARYLHTGELFGFAGQFVALLAALAALILVWSGFSLAIRRMTAWRKRAAKTERKLPVELISSV